MNTESENLAKARSRGADRVLVDVMRQTPVEIALRRKWRRAFLILGIILFLAIVIWVIRRVTTDKPVVYQTDLDHFYYGSIGSEPGGSVLHPVGGMLPPYEVFAVLPAMFPEKLPGGYAELGLLFERDSKGKERDLPIGVSRRQRLGMNMVGLNCAICHTGTLRTKPDGPRRHIPGMPSHQLDLQRFFRFVLDSVLDPRFTPDNVVGHVERKFGPMNPVERLVFTRALVPQIRERTLILRARVGPLFAPDAAPWGCGRVDTFNPYKSLQFGWPLERLPKQEIIAASDFPALWNQKPRDGMDLHWDGNNSSLSERNLSAGLGAGITPVTADFGAVVRVRNYIRDLPPPPWPEDLPKIDKAATDSGKKIYAQYCASCHDFDGSQIGKIVPIELIGTDRARLDSYTTEFADNQNTLFAGTTNRFKSFKKTNGYVNQPLDGIWARAPYLHNGSVPTLAHLLELEPRPAAFYRGCDLYDPARVGFVFDLPEENGRSYTRYEAVGADGKPVWGNSNQGHTGKPYGTELDRAEKLALLEYLKTI